MDTNLPAPNFDPSVPLAAAQRYQTGQVQQQIDQTELQKSQLALQQAQQAAPAVSSALQDTIMADALRKALDDPQNTDAYLQRAYQNGATAAKQYIGRPFNPFTLQNALMAYGGATSNQATGGQAASPLAAAAAPAAGGTAPTGGAEQDQTAMLDRQYANSTPQQLMQAAQHVNAGMASLYAVMNSANPQQEWGRQIKALQADGVPVPPNLQYSPLQVAQLYNALSTRAPYLNSRVAQQVTGQPAPLIPRNLIKTDAGVIEADPYAPPGTPGKMIAATPTYIRTNQVDAVGNPILADSHTGQTISGGAPAPAGAPVTEWAAKMQGVENGTGDRAAQNPNSTATGNAQFTDATWLQTAKTSLPDVTQGMSDAQILQLRNDPAFSTEMTVAYARQNGAQLATDHQPINGTTLALAHRFGATGASKILDAQPGDKMEDILPPSVIKANPELRGQTAGAYAQSMMQQFGLDPVDVGQGIPSTPRALSPEERELQTKVLPAQFEKAQESYESAQNLQLQLANMQDQMGQLGTSGFLAPGTGDTARLAFAKRINSLGTAMGMDPKSLPFDQNSVASGEDILKGTTRLGFDLARQLGSREAMMIVQQAVGAVPGVENTPRGARLIFGALNTAAQRQSDYYEYLQQWAQTHPNTLGADVAFNKAYPVQHYTNQALLAAVPAGRTAILKANPKLAPQFDAQYGKGLSAVVLGSQ